MSTGKDFSHRSGRGRQPDAISIVIPAHDEAEVIGRGLDALTNGAAVGELDIVVVCNGCTDKTARIARAYYGRGVRVVETPIADKAAALNLADAAAGAVFPRFYVDADVVIPLAGIRTLAARLESDGAAAASPMPRINLTGCSRCVGWFFYIASLLPSATEGIGGSGVYGMARSGRCRFGNFPDLISDDGFVRLQFESNEWAIVTSVTSEVFAPRNLRDLVRARTRVRVGHLQLARRFPSAWRARSRNPRSLAALFKNPLLWSPLLLYGVVILAARFFAKRRFVANIDTWERDDGSRTSLLRRALSP